eukprot:scaffold18575_cov104-Isochrysis_galbana.AAC.6
MFVYAGAAGGDVTSAQLPTGSAGAQPLVSSNHELTSSWSTSRQLGELFSRSVTAESGRGRDGSPARGAMGCVRNCLTNHAWSHELSMSAVRSSLARYCSSVYPNDRCPRQGP